MSPTAEMPPGVWIAALRIQLARAGIWASFGPMRGILFILVCGFAALAAQGCGGSIDQPFDMAYLTYGRPDYPMGTLVHVQHDRDGWKTVGEAELTKDAVLLNNPPYRTGMVPFISVVEAAGSKTSSFWNWPQSEGETPSYDFPIPDRVVVISVNNAAGTEALLCYFAANHINMKRLEYDRYAVTLGANARCSLAIMRYGAPDSLEIIGSCQYARPSWLPDGGVAYVSRGGDLVAYDRDSASVTELVPQVDSFSVGANGTFCAKEKVGLVTIFDEAGNRQGESIKSASVPMLSPDGNYLAYRSADNDLWIRTLDTGDEKAVGLGDPRNWSLDSKLLLFSERRRGDKGLVYTLFSVAEAASGKATALPEDGFIVDAVLFP